jgi:hypothetical protein
MQIAAMDALQTISTILDDAAFVRGTTGARSFPK